MSFFGKFLLVLNIVGAGALGWLAIQDYGKRQAWTYSVLAYDLILDGLPSMARIWTSKGVPLVRRITDDVEGEAGKTPLVTHLFSGVGGSGVATQAEEVKRAQAETMAGLQPLEGSRANTPSPWPASCCPSPTTIWNASSTLPPAPIWSTT